MLEKMRWEWSIIILSISNQYEISDIPELSVPTIANTSLNSNTGKENKP